MTFQPAKKNANKLIQLLKQIIEIHMAFFSLLNERTLEMLLILSAFFDYLQELILRYANIILMSPNLFMWAVLCCLTAGFQLTCPPPYPALQ